MCVLEKDKKNFLQPVIRGGSKFASTLRYLASDSESSSVDEETSVAMPNRELRRDGVLGPA
jgi:hypothetical protein